MLHRRFLVSVMNALIVGIKLKKIQFAENHNSLIRYFYASSLKKIEFFLQLDTITNLLDVVSFLEHCSCTVHNVGNTAQKCIFALQ